MTDEERRQRSLGYYYKHKEEVNLKSKERYRKKHPPKPKPYPNEKDRNLMVEKVAFPMIVIGGLTLNEEKRQRALLENKRASMYQLLLKKRWARDKKPQSIIIVEAGSMPTKNKTTYTAECYLKTPYDDDLREYWKSIVNEIIIDLEDEEDF